MIQMPIVAFAALFMLLVSHAGRATADSGSLFQAAAPLIVQTQNAALVGARAPLVQLRPAAPATATATASGNNRSTASLFSGREGASLFAPYPARRTIARRDTRAGLVGPARSATQVDRVRHLIAQAEAGSKGYDAVQHGATIRPTKAPTQMTLQEIYDWITATPGQPHAIGRYQFIPATLKRLVAMLGADLGEVFSPQMQNQLADILLVEAGFNTFSQGNMTRHAFMNNLAKIWAGLPNSSGKSHYDGFAGNHATMTWTHFDAEMARIFPPVPDAPRHEPQA